MTAPRTKKQKSRHAAWKRRKAKERRKRGECVRCGLPARPGKSRCEKHAVIDAKGQAMRELGLFSK